MSTATPFKALGAGNGFPTSLGTPIMNKLDLDYDSSSLNDVSLEVAMKHCWNIKSVTFGPFTFDLTQYYSNYWSYPNYEPKSLASDPRLAENRSSGGRYAADDTSISSEVFEISMGIGSALTVEGVRKYFHGIRLTHNNFSRGGYYSEIVTTYQSRPNFTTAQVAAKNVTTSSPILYGEEQSYYGDHINKKEFAQSVVTIGDIPFLKTVSKDSEANTTPADPTPSFNYPPDSAPATASFTFFEYS